MKNKLIKLLGGYTKDEVLTRAVKKLYNTIGSEDILREEMGQWTINGKPINDAIKKLLVSEAQIFLKSRLWQVLQTDIKYRANKVMFEKAQTEQDLIAGKLWLYTIDSIKTRLESLEKGSGRFNSDAQ